MVIMCLAWWLKAIQESDGNADELRDAVDDVKWVLSHITPGAVAQSATNTPGTISSTMSVTAVDPPVSSNYPVTDTTTIDPPPAMPPTATELPPTNSPLMAASLPEPCSSLADTAATGMSDPNPTAPPPEALPHVPTGTTSAPTPSPLLTTPSVVAAAIEKLDASGSLNVPALTATVGVPASSPVRECHASSITVPALVFASVASNVEKLEGASPAVEVNGTAPKCPATVLEEEPAAKRAKLSE